MPPVKGVGEPGAGEPHARFDGRELEKEPPWLPIKAALGKPRDLSPVPPTARRLASSLPDQPRLHGRKVVEKGLWAIEGEVIGPADL